jgi:cytoskeleton protein RodZ
MPIPQVRSEKAGEILRRTREARQLPLEEVAKKTKISMRFLNALEKGEDRILPADVFVRGFLRSYARILGLDPEEIVEQYKQDHGLTASGVDEDPARPLPLFFLWVSLAVIGVGLAAGLVFFFWPRSRSPILPLMPETVSKAEPAPGAEPVPKRETAAGAPQSPAPAAAAPAHSMDSVDLLFSRHCWVLVRTDNVKAYEGFKEAGDQLKYQIRDVFYLKVGDAGAVQVTHNGKPYPRLGDEGQPVELNITASSGTP